MPDIAVIGLGVVGRAQARMFASHGYGIVGYDVAEGKPYPAEAIQQCAFAVISVGTPQGNDGRADLTQVWEALHRLPRDLPVLIRSTMPPGTLDTWIRVGYSGLICHAPEFMHERPGGAWAESDDVPFLILGGDPKSRAFFIPFLAEFFSKIHECSALTAELVKYVVNLNLATRVTFINEMDAICCSLGADWEDVRAAWLMDPRITPEYTGGIAEFGPGFGGRCWPKDLAALIVASEESGYDPVFLKAVQEANRRFRS